MRSLLLAAALTLAAPAVAHANDGVYGGAGVHPMPLSSDSVRMADEIVTLRLDREGGAWDVRCSFVFENTTDEAVTLKIGFPFPEAGEYPGDLATPKGAKAPKPGDPIVWDFTTTVRGKPVNAKRGKTATNPDRPELNYGFAYFWEVTFAPRERVHIVNTYRHGVSEVVGGLVFANYVVKTGTTWKGGEIGHARLSVQVPSDRFVPCPNDISAEPSFARPAGFVVSPLHGEPGTEVHWSLPKFAPTEDVMVCMMDLDVYAQMHFWTDLAEGSLADKPKAELRLMRNEIYALHGYVFKDAALAAHFAKQWWYRPDPTFTPARLSKEERARVAAIREAERGVR